MAVLVSPPEPQVMYRAAAHKVIDRLCERCNTEFPLAEYRAVLAYMLAVEMENASDEDIETAKSKAWKNKDKILFILDTVINYSLYLKDATMDSRMLKNIRAGMYNVFLNEWLTAE